MSVHRIRSGDDVFQDVIAAMTSIVSRRDFHWRKIPAPGRMAPHTWAATAEILQGEDDLASGRLVVLHDPDGQEAWKGDYRLVALVQAQLEPEFAVESMLGDVAWSWVTESLELHEADARELGCTATRVVSQSYGSLAGRPSTVDVEMRISWTPDDDDLAAHFAAWGAMLAAAGGLPPVPAQVAPLRPEHKARAPQDCEEGEEP